MLFLNINGIPTEKPTGEKFWMMGSPMGYSLKEKDYTYDIEEQALYLRNLVAEKIFGSLETYYSLLPISPIWLSTAGIDSDIKVSKEEFEKVTQTANEQQLKFLYYYDVISLIGSLQNSVQEVKYLMGEFYKELNVNSFMVAPKPFEPDIVMFASGLMVTRIFSFVNHLFIALYSQLDFITKVCYELENMQQSFFAYSKLKSANILLGDAKRISLNNVPGSLFEETENLRLIQTLRNEIVHNGSFENLPKVFQVFEKGEMVEKFIFLPDHQNGIFKVLKSRKRFFNDEIKFNEILPELMFDF